MFLTLTNAAPNFKNEKIVINSNVITSFMRHTIVRNEGDPEETVTMIFCPPHGTWEVQETMEEILAQLVLNK